ncbi:SfnB family sulfur acquisition oxidoreductase [Halotalea alkalilenta]|uniref:SfnB family sulfur acquisition oxidoreductase n=1 Tax=Halotalea alkalilenta TaxID=376489 RepID=A0A172YDE3_9GAMM|nr:SfnB family sulfur acquisition oxidoreductase [Halotalea alkalilenta]ANF57281.1 SfnB family sulfur acquisition oxidoreductase [Halotalea alkalilenta]
MPREIPSKMVARKAIPPQIPAHRIESDEEAIETARRLADVFAREAALRDRERRLPWEELELFSQSGLGGILIPKAYGGAGVRFATVAEVFRLISQADPAIGQIPQNHFGTLYRLSHLASEPQRRRIYTAVLEGQRIGNAGPERHSRDVLDIRARLERDGTRWALSGDKFYSTGAMFAHWIPTQARLPDGEVVSLIVRREAPGISIVDDWSGIGQRTTASGSVHFRRTPVEDEDIFPAWPKDGSATLRGPFAQLLQAAIDAGIARGALEDTSAFVRERSRAWVDSGVTKASEDPLTIREFGDLRIRVDAADAVLHRAARLLDRLADAPLDDDGVAQASVLVAKAKVLSTRASLHCAEKLFELAGSRATLAEFNLDRHWRNARTHTLHDPVRWKYHIIANYELNGVHPPLHAWI